VSTPEAQFKALRKTLAEACREAELASPNDPAERLRLHGSCSSSRLLEALENYPYGPPSQRSRTDSGRGEA